MRLLALSSLVAAAILAAPLTVSASGSFEPGTVVSRTNLDDYRENLALGMQWVVDRGVKLRLGPYQKVEMPPAFVAATERYSAQVEVSEDCTHLLNHTAGLPFPEIKEGDSCLAARHMFNFNAAIAVDDLDIRNFDCDTGVVGRDGDSVKVERHFLIDHVRRLYWVERTEVDPTPAILDNPEEIRYREAMYPMIEPFDLKGTGFTFNRYLDYKRQDDTWLYLPQLRRVRRLSSAQRSDALFGQDTDQDSYAGYAGNVAWMEWKYLGEKTVLGSFHSEHLPTNWGEGSADFVHDDIWEPREAWVVEGKSLLPQYAYSKRVIYLDKESYRIPFTDIYDTGGELWKMWLNNYKYANAPIETAQYKLDHDVSFNPSITMIDMQLEHATFCALPSHRFPGEQGWYMNLGDKEGTVPEYFELSAIISAGR